jgi:hypothetical protein
VVATAIAKVFAMVLRFIIVSFAVLLAAQLLPPLHSESKNTRMGVQRG